VTRETGLPHDALTAQRDAPVGGQAVLEGVMMRGPSAWSVAVRKPDGAIAEVIALYKKACNDEASVGCGRLAAFYLTGKGVAVDFAAAKSLLDRGCTAGDLDACAVLGTLYRDGRGTPRDRIRALALFDRACASVGAACTQAGRLYELAGRSGDAQERYVAGCRLGDASSCALRHSTH